MTENEIKYLVRTTVAQCKHFFKCNGWIPDDWHPKVKLSFSQHRVRSWGGVRNNQPFISLALIKFANTTKATFHEYPSFAHDPEIGTIYEDTEKAVKALVIHEMCHALQHSQKQNLSASFNASSKDAKAHGSLWKNLYRHTRNTLVNY